MTNTLALLGCTPEPLIYYLKALGVLRLVAMQKAPDVRGCWEGNTFYIKGNYNHYLRNEGTQTASVLWICTPPIF